VEHDGLQRRRASPFAGGRSYDEDAERVGSDAWIRRYLNEHIVHNARERSVHDVIVEVRAGRVTLTGTVPHRGIKQSIEKLAAEAPGVIGVDNRLRVALTGPWPEEPST